MCRLRRGDFAQAWAEFEWRLRIPAYTQPRGFIQPQWKGESLNGKTILLHAEAGISDAVQFVRYAPLVAQRGGQVMLECQAKLALLFAGLPGVERVLVRGQRLPPFDFHCPLASLPLAFGTDLNSIPAAVPYLKVDEILRAKWSTRLGPSDGRRRIGVRWSGRPNFHRHRNPAIAPSELAPLMGTKDAVFYALQPAESPELVDFSVDLTDFSQTAAFIANLDLVLTVDTSVAHIAGAIGTPVWLMLPKVADWRWFLNRQDSPWYPTMRLFRQTEFGDWTPVVRNISQSLPADWKSGPRSVT